MMKPRNGRATLFMAAASLVLVPQRPTFRSAIDTVEVYATVRHSDGRLVPNLPREAFQILSDGTPVEVTIFSNEPKAITVALLIDTSRSTAQRVLWYRDSAGYFVDALLEPDRARIGSFGEEVAISPLLTNDKAVLRRVLRDELWPAPASGTPLWVAMNEGMQSIADEPGRRVVLVMTDGLDSLSTVLDPMSSAADTKRRAIQHNVMLYAVGVRGRGLGPYLRDLADDTGGGFRQVRDGDSLQVTMAEIAEELRHQYLLGFTPPKLDGRTHRLTVRLTSDHLEARAPREYMAQKRTP
jgi:VWFA-related protein